MKIKPQPVPVSSSPVVGKRGETTEWTGDVNRCEDTPLYHICVDDLVIVIWDPTISKSGKFRFDHVTPTSLSQPFDDLATAHSHM